MHTTNNIGYLIQHLSFSMSRQNDQILQERLGIGYSQFKIMMVLQKNPYIQQKDIADALGQTEASISRQIKLMHDKNLLQTRVNPDNRRRHMTVLTTKGTRLCDAAMESLNRYHGPMFEKLSEKERTRLIDILGEMHESVCQSGKAGACHRLIDI